MKIPILQRMIGACITMIFTVTTIAWSSPDGVYGIRVPEKSGTVKERWKSPLQDEQTKKPIVVHIQDAHTSLEAQKNIAALIEHFAAKNSGKTLRVYAEGAEGACDVAPYASFPDPVAKEWTATHFMKDGVLTGAEYQAITSTNQIVLYGAEHGALYQKNYDAYRTVVQYRDQLHDEIDAIEKEITSMRNAVCGEELKALFLSTHAYERGEKDLFSYLQEVVKKAHDTGCDLLPFINVSLFLEAMTSRMAVRDEALSAENEAARAALLEKDPSIILPRKSDQAGEEKDYYVFMKNAIFERNLDQSAYPALVQYAQFCEKYARVDMNRLLYEVRALRWEIERLLSVSSEEKALTDHARVLEMMRILIKLEAMPEDIQLMRSERDLYTVDAFYTMWHTYCGASRVLGIARENLDRVFQAIDMFYDIAEERNQAFVESILSREMNETAQNDIVLLVTGGYHSPGISEELRKRHVSYMVITPTLNSPETDIPYHDRMLMKPTALEAAMVPVSTLACQLTTGNKPLVSAHALSDFIAERPVVSPERHKRALLGTLYFIGLVRYCTAPKNEAWFSGYEYFRNKFSPEIEEKYKSFLKGKKWEETNLLGVIRTVTNETEECLQIGEAKIDLKNLFDAVWQDKPFFRGEEMVMQSLTRADLDRIYQVILAHLVPDQQEENEMVTVETQAREGRPGRGAQPILRKDFWGGVKSAVVVWLLACSIFLSSLQISVAGSPAVSQPAQNIMGSNTIDVEWSYPTEVTPSLTNIPAKILTSIKEQIIIDKKLAPKEKKLPPGFKVPTEDHIRSIIEKCAHDVGIPVATAMLVVKIECDGSAYKESSQGALGLVQIIPTKVVKELQRQFKTAEITQKIYGDLQKIKGTVLADSGANSFFQRMIEVQERYVQSDMKRFHLMDTHPVLQKIMGVNDASTIKPSTLYDLEVNLLLGMLHLKDYLNDIEIKQILNSLYADWIKLSPDQQKDIKTALSPLPALYPDLMPNDIELLMKDKKMVGWYNSLLIALAMYNGGPEIIKNALRNDPMGFYDNEIVLETKRYMFKVLKVLCEVGADISNPKIFQDPLVVHIVREVTLADVEKVRIPYLQRQIQYSKLKPPLKGSKEWDELQGYINELSRLIAFLADLKTNGRSLKGLKEVIGRHYQYILYARDAGVIVEVVNRSLEGQEDIAKESEDIAKESFAKEEAQINDALASLRDQLRAEGESYEQKEPLVSPDFIKLSFGFLMGIMALLVKNALLHFRIISRRSRTQTTNLFAKQFSKQLVNGVIERNGNGVLGGQYKMVVKYRRELSPLWYYLLKPIIFLGKWVHRIVIKPFLSADMESTFLVNKYIGKRSLTILFEMHDRMIVETMIMGGICAFVSNVTLVLWAWFLSHYAWKAADKIMRVQSRTFKRGVGAFLVGSPFMLPTLAQGAQEVVLGVLANSPLSYIAISGLIIGLIVMVRSILYQEHSSADTQEKVQQSERVTTFAGIPVSPDNFSEIGAAIYKRYSSEDGVPLEIRLTRARKDQTDDKNIHVSFYEGAKELAAVTLYDVSSEGEKIAWCSFMDIPFARDEERAIGERELSTGLLAFLERRGYDKIVFPTGDHVLRKEFDSFGSLMSVGTYGSKMVFPVSGLRSALDAPPVHIFVNVDVVSNETLCNFSQQSVRMYTQEIPVFFSMTKTQEQIKEELSNVLSFTIGEKKFQIFGSDSLRKEDAALGEKMERMLGSIAARNIIVIDKQMPEGKVSDIGAYMLNKGGAPRGWYGVIDTEYQFKDIEKVKSDAMKNQHASTIMTHIDYFVDRITHGILLSETTGFIPALATMDTETAEKILAVIEEVEKQQLMKQAA